MEVVALELEIWREACLQKDLPEFIDRLTQLVARRVPVTLVCVQRLDPEWTRLETAAASSAEDLELPRPGRHVIPESFRERFLAWCRAGQVAIETRRGTEPRDTLIGLATPDGFTGAYALGPLRGPEGPLGVLAFLARPGCAFAPDHAMQIQKLLAPVSAALDRDRLRHQMSRLQEAALADERSLSLPQDIAESIVGAETGLKGVMERVELVAHTDTPVLILGETGSGKEVVARAIHARSRRVTGPILRVNCGAIPPELIDSELFGHERGSFTGAVQSRKGWFERVDGGTLFLDEIGELPLAAQVRLLRILQDGTFERVGAQRTQSVDVRLVAATHRDLHAMVRERRFREDLWYRINVFPIRLPPLRQRREDIPALSAHFARRAGLRLGGLPLTPSAGDLDLLFSYDWPGNIRELAAVIERAAILGNGARLELAKALGPAGLGTEAHEGHDGRDGHDGLRAHDGHDRRDGFDGRDGPNDRGSEGFRGTGGPGALGGVASALFPTLDQAMAGHIEDALTRTNGRIEGAGGAASLLGINPHTLRARMRKLGIEWRRFRDRPGA